MLASTVRAASRIHAAARTAAAARTSSSAARPSSMHSAQRSRSIFNEALAMTPEARAGDHGPHISFLRAAARRLVNPTGLIWSSPVATPHGVVHVALEGEPELTSAEELERAAGERVDRRRIGWEYR